MRLETLKWNDKYLFLIISTDSTSELEHIREQLNTIIIDKKSVVDYI